MPDSGDTLSRHWSQQGHPETPVAGQVYSELVASAGPAAAPHEAYLAISLDLKAAKRLISQAGGGYPAPSPCWNRPPAPSRRPRAALD